MSEYWRPTSGEMTMAGTAEILFLMVPPLLVTFAEPRDRPGHRPAALVRGHPMPPTASRARASAPIRCPSLVGGVPHPVTPSSQDHRPRPRRSTLSPDQLPRGCGPSERSDELDLVHPAPLPGIRR